MTTPASPTRLGLTALVPAPMAAADVADLLYRARARGAAVRREALRRASILGNAARRNKASMCRLAAHLRRFMGCSLAASARIVRELTGQRVSISGIDCAYATLYPRTGRRRSP